MTATPTGEGLDPARVGLAAATFLALEVGAYGIWQPFGRPLAIPAVVGAIVGLGSVVSLHLVARWQPKALGNVLGAWLGLVTVLVLAGAFGTRSLRPAWDLLLSALLLLPVQLRNLALAVERGGADALPFVPFYFLGSPITMAASFLPALAAGAVRARWEARGPEVVLAVGTTQGLALLATVVPPVRTPYGWSPTPTHLVASVAGAAAIHAALAGLGWMVARPVDAGISAGTTAE